MTPTPQKLTLEGLMELVRIFGGTRWSERVEPSADKAQARISAYTSVEHYASRLIAQSAQEAMSDEFLRILAEELGMWCEPYEAATECGNPIECGISEEDAKQLNAETLTTLREAFARALLASKKETP